MATDIPIMERTMPMELHVLVRLEDGSFWATIEEYPGVHATGDNLDELRESLEEGLSLVLAGPGETPQPVKLTQLSAEPVEAAATASACLVPA